MKARDILGIAAAAATVSGFLFATCISEADGQETAQRFCSTAVTGTGPQPCDAEADFSAVLNPRAPITVTIVNCQSVEIDDGHGTHLHAKLICPKDR